MMQVNGTMTGSADITGTLSGTPATNNYEKLSNKPKINGVELVGDKSFEELGIDGNFVTEEKLTEELAKITIPKKVSELENDNKYQTEDDVSKAMQEVEEKIPDITSLSNKVDELQKKIDSLIDGNEVAY